MTRFELCVALSELQTSFSIHPNAQTDFDSEAGDFQADRLLDAAGRRSVTLSKSMLRKFAVEMEETPASGSKLVDILIEKTKAVAGAAAGADKVPSLILGAVSAREPGEDEFSEARKTLVRFGVDPDADPETRQKQWRKKFYEMRHGATQAVSLAAPKQPMSREEVQAALRSRRTAVRSESIPE